MTPFLPALLCIAIGLSISIYGESKIVNLSLPRYLATKVVGFFMMAVGGYGMYVNFSL